MPAAAIHPVIRRIHQKLHELQEIADQKASQMERSNYKKYAGLFDAVVAFLKRKKVLLYGGAAINELMPKALKIYKEETLPDIDIFCVDGKKVAESVVKHFKKSGYTFTSASEALHPGTYKVFAEGMQVLDVTSLSKKAFKRLGSGGHLLDNGLRTVDPEFLRMTLHVMLSQPRDSHRWSKVLARTVAFYEAFPMKATGCKATLAKAELTPAQVAKIVPEGFHENVAEWTRGSGANGSNGSNGSNGVLFGSDVVMQMLGMPTGVVYKGVAPIAILCTKATDVAAKDLIAHLTQLTSVRPTAPTVPTVPKVTKVTNVPKLPKYAPTYALITTDADEFVPTRTTLMVGKQPLVSFYEAPACLSYVEVGMYGHTGGHSQVGMYELKVASVHTTLRMMMSHMFSEQPDLVVAAVTQQCLINLLSILMLNTMTGSKKKLLQQFVLQCYGKQPGVATLRRNRMKRLAGLEASI